jgi:hypothetical protein
MFQAGGGLPENIHKNSGIGIIDVAAPPALVAPSSHSLCFSPSFLKRDSHDRSRGGSMREQRPED